MDKTMGGRLVAFEVIWRNYYEFNTGDKSAVEKPLDTETDYYVILETFEFSDIPDNSILEGLLGSLIDAGLVVDGLITKSEDERRRVWDVRENLDAEMTVYDMCMGYDLSLPQRSMEEYTNRLKSAVALRWPEGVVFAYGHVGDGNLHYAICNIEQGEHHSVDSVVYGLLKDYGGSISAEHGIGLEKKSWLGVSRSDVEIDIMRSIKKALDPAGILNAGKIFDMTN
jgi:FAD/FMN-containing dehydrogenase